MRKMTYIVPALLLALHSHAAMACSIIRIPIEKRYNRTSLVVKPLYYRVEILEKRGSPDTYPNGAKGVLHLLKIKCRLKPKGFAACPVELHIPFDFEDDGMNCGHVLSGAVFGFPHNFKFFELRPRDGGGWFISSAAVRMSDL